jgi:hypothetical protein
MKKLLILFILLLNGIASFTQTPLFTTSTANKKVLSMVRYNNTIYIGGEFDSVASSPQPFLASLDASTGALLTWNPAPDRNVTRLMVKDGKLIVYGDFDTIAGTARVGLAVFDLLTGNILNSTIGNSYTTGQGLTQEGNHVYYCGAGPNGIIPRRFDINTLQDDPLWTGNEGVNGDVNSMTILGNHIYLGGWFYLTNFPSITQLCRFDLSTGNLDTAFHFSFNGNDVKEIIGHNGMLYVGGNYNMLGGFSRNGITEINPAGQGSVTSKSFNCSNQNVGTITVQGNTLWVGGNSVVIGGLNRYTIAQVDIQTGIATCWFTQTLSGNIYHNSIIAMHDTVYVAPQLSGVHAFTGNPGYVDLGNDTVLCAGNSITLEGPIGQFTYLWSNGQITPAITVNTPGFYWLSASDQSGCKVSGAINLSACTAMQESEEFTGLKVYPTISQGRYSVELLSINEITFLEITDIAGRVFYKSSLTPRNLSAEVDIRNSPDGLYLLRLYNSKSGKTVKLLKE